MLTIKLAMKALETLCKEDFGELYRDSNAEWERFLIRDWVNCSYENIRTSMYYQDHDALIQELWDATEGEIGYGDKVPEHALDDWNAFKTTLYGTDDDTAHYMEEILTDGVLGTLLDTKGLQEAIEAKYGSGNETH